MLEPEESRTLNDLDQVIGQHQDRDLDRVKDQGLDQAILEYLHIPYFHNNPSYLGLFHRHFRIHRDPALLFLMRMKGVGTLTSWLYARLVEYFEEKKCPACVQTVVKEGLRALAHPIREMEDLAAGLGPPLTPHALERPSRIRVLGRDWVQTVRLGYDRGALMLGAYEMSYTEYKLRAYALNKHKTQAYHELYKEQKAQDYDDLYKHRREMQDYDLQRKKLVEEEVAKGLDEVSLLFGSGAAGSTDAGAKRKSRDASPPPATKKCASPTSPLSDIQLDVVDPDIQLDEDLEPGGRQESPLLFCTGMESAPAAAPSQAGYAIQRKDRSFGTPGLHDKVVIEGILYIGKKVLGDHTLMVTRIASLSDGNITLNARDYVLRHRNIMLPDSHSEYNRSVLLRSLAGFCVVPDLVVEYMDKLVSLCSYHEMGSLAAAIRAMIEKQGDYPEVLAAHYLKELLRIGQAVSEKGYTIAACSLDDFVVLVDNGKIGVRLASYHTIARGSMSPSAPVLRRVVQQANTEHALDLLSEHADMGQWTRRLQEYLGQKRESIELQNLFIAQEVSIYEGG